MANNNDVYLTPTVWFPSPQGLQEVIPSPSRFTEHEVTYSFARCFISLHLAVRIRLLY
jgi:hypothetical protein